MVESGKEYDNIVSKLLHLDDNNSNHNTPRSNLSREERESAKEKQIELEASKRFSLNYQAAEHV